MIDEDESQLDLGGIPPEYADRVESKNAYVWYQGGILEYILLIVAIAIVLIFLIPFSNKYYIWIYFISLISYAIVIFFVYFWSKKNDKRGMRLMLLFFIFVLLLSQLFNYYTDNNVVAVIMYLIALLMLIYIVVRGFMTWFTIAMMIPLAFIIYQIVIHVIIWINGDTSLPN